MALAGQGTSQSAGNHRQRYRTKSENYADITIN